MSKLAVRFVCQKCGASFPKWMGRCSTCGEWNGLVEEVAERRAVKGPGSAAPRAKKASDIDTDEAARIPTGIHELDRVLGGGAVQGGVTLVGGDPGVGKSTLLLQALAGMAKRGHKTLYVSGEESASQTAARARRIGGESSEVYVLAENDFDAIAAVLDDVAPAAVVLDSVQTVRVADLESAAGTVSQLREVATRMVDRAKRDRIATFLVGHVTKDGVIAGPKVLEHIVDTVLAFEGERGQAFRTLRTQKNRFGSATEVGIFEMSGDGLREVPNPSALFLGERPRGAAGSVIAATGEGSRSMLVEVQALVGPVSAGSPRRTATGVDGTRLAMVLAVLERKVGITVSASDIFVNLAGGMRVDEPALDLAVAIALASSARGKAVDPSLVVFGEIGLAGEVRNVARSALRLAEAKSMGFTRAIVPSRVAEEVATGKTDMDVLGVRTIEEAISASV
ncbi:MAG: DNA repair protein RadA [Polyangiaceae bacterium]